MRQRRWFRQIARNALDGAALDLFEHGDQPVNVHRLGQTVLNGLLHQRMVGNLAVAGDVLQAGQLVREHRGQEVLRFHALERRGNFAPAPLPRQRQRARRVPPPADREHRRIQQCLHQQIAHRSAVKIAEDFVQREGVLRAEREHDGVVRGCRLQFEVKGTAETFAQR